jgi:poly-beta-1,6-N-acetyl-D-glucosamine synthase
MKSIFLILFISGFSWLIYVYVGYPISLWLIGLRISFRPESKDNFLPSLSVLISARNEEKDIAQKISETLNWNYPKDRLEVLIASDASQDRTDEIIRGVDDPRLKYLLLGRRVGKNEALNRLAQIATGEIFLFTDANSHIHSDCARRLVRHFADSKVGCVTGSDRTMRGAKESAIGMGEKTYLGYESQLQKLESRLGSVLICFGAIFCIRGSLFAPLQPDLANDLELPVRIGSAGFALIFEPEAWATEKPTQSPKEEFNRRRRICGQGLLGFWRLRKSWHGLRAWQFVSRKVLRWTAAFPLLLLLLSSAGLSVKNPIFRVFLIVELAFYAAAFVGWVLATLGRQEGRVFALPFYFVLVNIAALVGLIETCLGRRYSVWEVASLTRGTEAT